MDTKTKAIATTFNKKSLEECLTEIETIQQKLNEGNLPLEEMMALYEYGKIISQIAQEKLDEIEFKFKKLNDKNNDN